MNSTADSEHPVLIAVPCYGSRVLPRFGQAREFFFAEADLASRTLRGLRRQSWDLYEEPQMIRWLCRAGVDIVLCGGIHPRFQVALLSEEIGVVWGFRGEVEEVLGQWLKEEDLAKGYYANSLTGQADCQPRRMTRGACQHRDGQGES
jgi:predicted Fe-Mo cluster-binding NifX family protein